MHTTSHQPMRSRLIIPRQRQADPEQGCIRAQRPGRANEERSAIAESAGIR